MSKDVTLKSAPPGHRGVRHNDKRFILDQTVTDVSDADVKVLEGLAGHKFEVTDSKKETK